MAEMPTKEQLTAGLEIVAAVAEAIKGLGSVPSGHLYAHLMHVLTLDEYTSVISLLKRQNLVRESGFVLTWVGGA
jgi:hypothetical protein